MSATKPSPRQGLRAVSAQCEHQRVAHMSLLGAPTPTSMGTFRHREQVKARTKDVTRRTGWLRLQTGDVLQPVEKCMGIPKGYSVIRIGGPIRVRSVLREILRRLLDDEAYGQSECIREGFPDLAPMQFVEFFCSTHRGCTADTELTRADLSLRSKAPMPRLKAFLVSDGSASTRLELHARDLVRAQQLLHDVRRGQNGGHPDVGRRGEDLIVGACRGALDFRSHFLGKGALASAARPIGHLESTEAGTLGVQLDQNGQGGPRRRLG